MPSLQLGGALTQHRSVLAASSSEPPASMGLACRPVGAWRRHLVKQINYTGRKSLPGDLAVWDGHVAMDRRQGANEVSRKKGRRFESCRGHSVVSQFSDGFRATAQLLLAPFGSVPGRCLVAYWVL